MAIRPILPSLGTCCSRLGTRSPHALLLPWHALFPAWHALFPPWHPRFRNHRFTEACGNLPPKGAQTELHHFQCLSRRLAPFRSPRPRLRLYMCL
eukprot:15483616-Alexandrium_andersonii.AAC.1